MSGGPFRDTKTTNATPPYPIHQRCIIPGTTAIRTVAG